MKVFLTPSVEAEVTTVVTWEELSETGAVHELQDGESRALLEVVPEVIDMYIDRRELSAAVSKGFNRNSWWMARATTVDDGIRLEPFASRTLIGISEDGRFVSSYPRDILIDNYIRAVQAGHYGDSVADIAVTKSGNQGGNGFVVLSVVGWMIQAFGPILVEQRFSRHQWRKKRAQRRQLEDLARDWAAHGINYPREVREFVDSQSSWSPDLLGTRLGIGLSAAEALLAQLGYLPTRFGLMETSDSSVAREARQTWLEAETVESFASVDEILESYYGD